MMVGAAKHAAPCRILGFTTKNFAATPATIPWRTWSRFVHTAMPASIAERMAYGNQLPQLECHVL